MQKIFTAARFCARIGRKGRKPRTAGSPRSAALQKIFGGRKLVEMAQILAVVIFAVMFLLIVTEKIERHWVSLGCGLLMLVVVFGLCMHSPAAVWNTLGLQSFASVDLWYQPARRGDRLGHQLVHDPLHRGHDAHGGGMGRAGFFRWLCLQLARLVKYKTIRCSWPLW